MIKWTCVRAGRWQGWITEARWDDGLGRVERPRWAVERTLDGWWLLIELTGPVVTHGGRGVYHGRFVWLREAKVEAERLIGVQLHQG